MKTTTMLTRIIITTGVAVAVARGGEWLGSIQLQEFLLREQGSPALAYNHPEPFLQASVVLLRCTVGDWGIFENEQPSSRA